MSYCPRCKRSFREPLDEQGDHGCPRCGPYEPELDEDEQPEEEEAANDEPEDVDDRNLRGLRPTILRRGGSGPAVSGQP